MWCVRACQHAASHVQHTYTHVGVVQAWTGRGTQTRLQRSITGCTHALTDLEHQRWAEPACERGWFRLRDMRVVASRTGVQPADYSLVDRCIDDGEPLSVSRLRALPGCSTTASRVR